MPSLVGTQAGMNVYDYRSPGYNYNGLGNNHDLSYNRDDTFDRDDMRREDEDRFKRNARNGGPPHDRFVDYLADRDRGGGMMNVNSGEPTFLLDHLATFAAGTRNGPLHAEEGLRKLRQMENTTGIWTMRCQLVVERGFLIIVDNGNGEELERFPIQNVTDPTAIFKNDHREHYNSLILFTIVDDPKKKITQADMHIFQTCGGNPPQAIVDEILAAKAGQPRLGGGSNLMIYQTMSSSHSSPYTHNYFRSKIPPPPMGPAPEPPNGAYNFQNMREYLDNQRENNYGQGQFGAAARVPQNSMLARVSAIREKEDIDGGATEIMERDVQLLNHCFDDIEKFVARLQQAAESFKELERRKRERGAKNKKRQSGDGMLNARARPPNDRDFVDIFQKFKLSFNLLAKLKAHIHDPNAPELVHFLFTPLSLIYEASRDPYHGNQNLGDQAVAPVLTTEAKLLLQNCLTSKELELWHALGKHWTTCRSEWQGLIPPYVPQFFDGWQPAGSVIDDVASRSASMHQGGPPHVLPVSEPIRHPPMNDHQVQYHGPPARPTPFPDEDSRPLHPPSGLDRYSNNNNHHAYNNGPHPPISNNYSHQNGDLDRPPSEDYGRTNNKFPLMSRQDENAQYLEEMMRMDDALIYEAAHDRMGKNAKELDVQKGDIVQVLDNSKNWWKLRNYKGMVGFAPYTILKAIRSEDDLDRNGGGPISARSGMEPARPSSRRDERNPSRLSNIYSDLPTTTGGLGGIGRGVGGVGGVGANGITTSANAAAVPARATTPSWQPASLLQQQQLQPPPPPPLILPKQQTQQPQQQQPTAPTQYSSHAPPPTRIPRQRSPSPAWAITRLTPPPVPVASSNHGRHHHSPRPSISGESILPDYDKSSINDVEMRQHNSGRDNLKEPGARTSQASQLQQQVQQHQNRQSRVVLDYRSPPEDVAVWLQYKGFRPSTVNLFSGYNGLDLFSLRLEDMQDVLVHEEAIRLDGLMRLQKNASGYKTKSSKELNAILQRRKEHVKNTDWQQAPPQIEPAEESTTDFRETGREMQNRQNQQHQLQNYQQQQQQHQQQQYQQQQYNHHQQQQPPPQQQHHHHQPPQVPLQPREPVVDRVEMRRHQPQQQQYHQQQQQQQQQRQSPSFPDYRNVPGVPGPASQHNFKDLLVRQRSQLRQSQADLF